MRRLTTDRYLRARAFLHDRARPLERAAFEHEFEGGPAWPVFDALDPFQNPDGGFGHGLEPDARTGASGALATSVALRVLADVRAPADHPTVRGAVAYLKATLDPNARTWRIVPEATAEAPHAPWWDAQGLAERFHGFRLNPKADLVARLYALCDASEEPWLDGLADDVVREVEARDAGDLGMHDLLAAARLLDAPHVPPGVRARLVRALTPVAVATVGRTPDDWAGYGLRPLALAPRPDAALAPALAGPVSSELDHLVATQADDGAWWPVWTWGAGAEADAWARARTEWAGMLTLDALRQLRAYGRLDRA